MMMPRSIAYHAGHGKQCLGDVGALLVSALTI